MILRDVDSIFSYVSYRNRNTKRNRLKAQDIEEEKFQKNNLVKAIKWNDTTSKWTSKLFQGKLNLLRNVEDTKHFLERYFKDTSI